MGRAGGKSPPGPLVVTGGPATALIRLHARGEPSAACAPAWFRHSGHPGRESAGLRDEWHCAEAPSLRSVAVASRQKRNSAPTPPPLHPRRSPARKPRGMAQLSEPRAASRDAARASRSTHRAAVATLVATSCSPAPANFGARATLVAPASYHLAAVAQASAPPRWRCVAGLAAYPCAIVSRRAGRRPSAMLQQEHDDAVWLEGHVVSLGGVTARFRPTRAPARVRTPLLRQASMRLPWALAVSHPLSPRRFAQAAGVSARATRRVVSRQHAGSHRSDRSRSAGGGDGRGSGATATSTFLGVRTGRQQRSTSSVGSTSASGSGALRRGSCSRARARGAPVPRAPESIGRG